MRRRLLYILFVLTSPYCIFAQSSGQLLGTDSVAHRVMVIPFNQYNYLSDADPQLAKENDMEAEEISRMFRYGLNYNVSARVISNHGTYNILTDTAVQSMRDLELIYGSVQYRFEKPMDVTSADTATDHALHQPDLFGNGGEAETTEESKKISFKKDDAPEKAEKYLNAHVKDPTIFNTLKERYDTDIFIFINQFELVTNYNHCLDRSKNYFERKVVVHYSIYNADGEQLKGDAMTVTFSSAQTNVDEIIATQFPLIADYLSTTVTALTKPASTFTK